MVQIKKPEILTQIENNPTKYIDYLMIDQVNGYDGRKGKWFKNIKIELNHELIAIIGNKGKGKSAIAEIIGLCGNSRIREDDLSFLNSQKRSNAYHTEYALLKNDLRR